MKRSFKSIFIMTFLLSLGLLVLGEWLVNQDIVTSHVLGWAFVATFIAALLGIVGKKEDSLH